MSPVMCLYSKTPGTQDHTDPKGLKWETSEQGCLPGTSSPRGANLPSLAALHQSMESKGYTPEFSAHGSHQGHRMNASEKNKKRNKNYNIRPKENEKKKRKKDVRDVVWNSVTVSYKNTRGQQRDGWREADCRS